MFASELPCFVGRVTEDLACGYSLVNVMEHELNMIIVDEMHRPYLMKHSERSIGVPAMTSGP
jgi:hypothetical protein